MDDQNCKKSGSRFHFVLDNMMIMELKKVKENFSDKEFEEYIVDIMGRLYPLMEHIHFFTENQESRYRHINPDLGIPRIDLYINIPRKLYNRIKAVHRDVNFYSMAQVIRIVLRFFLDLVNKFGSGLELVIDYIREIMEKIKTEYSRNSIPIRKELNPCHKVGSDWLYLGETPLRIVYDSLFYPEEIYLL